MAWNVSFHKSTRSIHHPSLATFPNPLTLPVSQCFLLPFLVKIIVFWTDQSFLLAPNILHRSLHFFPASWACYIKNISMQFRKIRSKTCIRLISWFPTIYFTGFIPIIYFAHFNPTALIICVFQAKSCWTGRLREEGSSLSLYDTANQSVCPLSWLGFFTKSKELWTVWTTQACL